MRIPPAQETKQRDYVKTALRLPEKLRDELQDAAARNGRSMNAEILARLEMDQLEEIKQQNVEIKAMLRAVLDKL